VLAAVNTRNTSGLLMVERDLLGTLGDTRRDSGGVLVSAGVATLTLIGQVNMTELAISGTMQAGFSVDRLTDQVERELTTRLTNISGELHGVTAFPMVANMFFEEMENMVFKDARMLIVGYLIVFLYLWFILGRVSRVGQRFLLAAGGMVGVVMGMAVSYSLCSAMGLFYGPMHTVLPFLLLGIGIDNMFVIRACLASLPAEAREGPVEGRLRAVMQRAGVAITVTSITDFIAFGIGASTELPVLRSFCIYAAVGILTIFALQSTWFCALLALDEARVAAGRDGCLCFLAPPAPGPGVMRGAGGGERAAAVFRGLAGRLVRRPCQAAVLALAAVLLCLGLWGATELTTEFQVDWLIDPDSAVGRYIQQRKEHFSSNGMKGALYIKAVDYPASLVRLEALVAALEQEPGLVSRIDSWLLPFRQFVSRTEGGPGEAGWAAMDEGTFRRHLAHFLFSPPGARYRAVFSFNGSLVCGQPAPRVLVSVVDFQFMYFTSASQWVPAMDRVYQLVAEANITAPDGTTGVLNHSPVYANWSADKTIQHELYRNLGSAFAAIFLAVMLFLGSPRGAGLVLFCVAGTVAEVAGFMHLWGLTMNLLTCVMLVISVGLCVDFSAHIVHFFMAAVGSREERIIHTLTTVGPAVFNGGLSTFLAFVLLSTSRSYVFLSFFKIFFLICVFGLFHGLVVLPVLLALVGPLDHGQEGEGGKAGKEGKGGKEGEEEGVAEGLLMAPVSSS
jgi:predicted RND superfamily exporter protein